MVLMTLVGQNAAFAQNAPATAPAKKHAPVKKALSRDQQQIEQLKQLIETQQQQISQQNQTVDQLRTQMQQLIESSQQTNAAVQKIQDSAAQAQGAASQAQQSATQAQDMAAKASSSSAETKASLALVDNQSKDEAKQVTALQGLFSRFRFSGDIRVRGESYDQTTVPDRNRARIRVRFGVDSQLNQDFVAGFALASGSLGDPSSTNETLTNVFDRKTVGIDRAFITYNPVAHKWLSLTGGKFAFTWQRTSATFDPDLNPEGFNEKLSFDLHGPVLKNFTAQGIELLYNEVTAGSDSFAVGGQVSARMQFGPWSVTPSFLSLKWNKPDGILQQSAFATQATTTGAAATSTTAALGPFPLPGEGQGCAKGLTFPAYAPCVFAPNGMTNATYVNSSGAHFYSGYNYADFILNNQIATGAARFPVNLILEFEDNLDAEAHPLDSTGKIRTDLGSQNHQYGGDLSIGQAKNKNDLQFGYGFNREEQDAVIASFVESDQRAPTNILQNKIYGTWKVRSNTLASFTWWRGHVLNTALENNAALFNNWSSFKTVSAAGQKEPYLNRLQFDLVYTY
jgi:hypothetical protein